MLLADEYSFLDLFVIVGIAAFLLSALGNSLYVGKSDARAVTNWREGDGQGARALLARTTRFHIVDNAVLIIAVIAMVYRWGSLAVDEQTCCGIFTFTIGIQPDSITLDVTGPTDAQPVITAMFGMAA